MKRLIVLAAILTGVGLVRAADDFGYKYLYWQVQASQVDAGVKDYNYAYLYTIGSDDSRTLIDWKKWDTVQTAGNRVDSAYSPPTVDLRKYAGNSFVLELALLEGGNSTVVGTSGLYDYETLSSFMSGVESMTAIPTQNLWAPAIMIPEPTSGLLMLFGLAGLALRRKRA